MVPNTMCSLVCSGGSLVYSSHFPSVYYGLIEQNLDNKINL